MLVLFEMLLQLHQVSASGEKAIDCAEPSTSRDSSNANSRSNNSPSIGEAVKRQAKKAVGAVKTKAEGLLTIAQLKVAEQAKKTSGKIEQLGQNFEEKAMKRMRASKDKNEGPKSSNENADEAGIDFKENMKEFGRVCKEAADKFGESCREAADKFGESCKKAADKFGKSFKETADKFGRSCKVKAKKVLRSNENTSTAVLNFEENKEEAAENFKEDGNKAATDSKAKETKRLKKYREKAKKVYENCREKVEEGLEKTGEHAEKLGESCKKRIKKGGRFFKRKSKKIVKPLKNKVVDLLRGKQEVNGTDQLDTMQFVSESSIYKKSSCDALNEDADDVRLSTMFDSESENNLLTDNNSHVKQKFCTGYKSIPENNH
ncbi:hypothetical protein NEMIN01_1406 [Nematocida minor]|uniref:uncharacterized protein n=1 Tax=Nematocida minor TaxID=1912983 RepID=UPI0022209D2D|nr:uncharacterized protein NEMIN01_1406 [Nematocida minor]KAI5191198.1 hypothetical protein NEMIN01_1406 [Nematocida minor]